MRGAFGGHVVWQAQYLANLDDVLKGSNIACGRRRTSDASGEFFVAGAI